MYHLPGEPFKRQSGQALLLMLLVMALVLTLVLSSVSRSVTDVDISKYEDSSIRAFDAAQAGIEKTVIAPTPVADHDLGNQAFYTSTVSEITQSTGGYKYPVSLASGESAIISFVDHKFVNGDYVMDCSAASSCGIPNQLRVCWGIPGTSRTSATTPALYMEFYYNSKAANPTKWMGMADLSDIKIATISADPWSARPGNNYFDALDPSNGNPCVPSNGYEFTSHYSQFKTNYLPSWIDRGMLLYAKITMLYNDVPQPLFVRTAPNLPGQGWVISSTGQSGDAYRKLVLFQGYPEIPTEFENAIYSKGNLIK